MEPLIRNDVPALRRSRLSWSNQNFIRNETLTEANACLVAAQNSIPLVQAWGGGEVASADGMRLVVPVRTLHAGPNPKYFGYEHGVTYYNLISDQFTGLNAIVVPGTLRDSLFLLAVVLEQQTELAPTEIMTDTGAYTDVVFGLFWLLGYRFSPRIADIGGTRYWRIDQTAEYGLLNGIGRHRINRQEGKEAVSLDLIRRMVATVEGTLTASRDRALILTGFAGGLRRSELAQIEVGHLLRHPRGITITLQRSKTDQEGQGREVEIARGSQPEHTPLAECTCPVRALEQWLRQASIHTGPVFRKVNRGENVQQAALNPASVAWILKRALKRAGVRDLDRFGAHSLRSGFATTAFGNGVPEFKIRQQTGHKTSRMLEKYIRSERKARQEAAGSLGL